MSPFVKNLFIAGAILTIGGSFLPWRQEGDFISYWTYGISVIPAFKDHGGFLIVLLTLVMVMLIFRPFDFIDKPTHWSIAFGAGLVVDSIFLIGKVLVDHMNFHGVFGVPAIMIGLVTVCLGSILLLVGASINHLRSFQ